MEFFIQTLSVLHPEMPSAFQSELLGVKPSHTVVITLASASSQIIKAFMAIFFKLPPEAALFEAKTDIG